MEIVPINEKVSHLANSSICCKMSASPLPKPELLVVIGFFFFSIVKQDAENCLISQLDRYEQLQILQKKMFNCSLRERVNVHVKILQKKKFLERQGWITVVVKLEHFAEICYIAY